MTGKRYIARLTLPLFSIPATRAQASTLLISNSHHLRANLGIKIPESLVARMVITSDNSEAWGISESGLIHLPLARLYEIRFSSRKRRRCSFPSMIVTGE